VFFDKMVCFCSIMNRIDLLYLVWLLEFFVVGWVVNWIVVEFDVVYWVCVVFD